MTLTMHYKAQNKTRLLAQTSSYYKDTYLKKKALRLLTECCGRKTKVLNSSKFDLNTPITVRKKETILRLAIKCKISSNHHHMTSNL